MSTEQITPLSVHVCATTFTQPFGQCPIGHTGYYTCVPHVSLATVCTQYGCHPFQYICQPNTTLCIQPPAQGLPQGAAAQATFTPVGCNITVASLCTPLCGQAAGLPPAQAVGTAATVCTQPGAGCVVAQGVFQPTTTVQTTHLLGCQTAVQGCVHVTTTVQPTHLLGCHTTVPGCQFPTQTPICHTVLPQCLPLTTLGLPPTLQCPVQGTPQGVQQGVAPQGTAPTLITLPFCPTETMPTINQPSIPFAVCPQISWHICPVLNTKLECVIRPPTQETCLNVPPGNFFAGGGQTPHVAQQGLVPQATLGPIQCNITVFSICTPVCG